MRTGFFTLLMFLSLIALHAQSDKKVKKGTIPTEELTMTSCPVDPDAEACILDISGNYYFDRYYYFSNPELRTFYEYKVRMKIFTEAGRKYATICIPFRGFEQYDNILGLTGSTYNLEANGKVSRSKLKAKTIRWERNGQGIWKCTFTLPDVKPGSVIEYKYQIASLDFLKLRDWEFQKNIPVINSEVRLTTPNFFQYGFFSNLPANQLAFQKSDKNIYLTFYNTHVFCTGNELQLVAHNIPAFKKEIFMPDSASEILKGQFLLSNAITKPSEFSGFPDRYYLPYIKPLIMTTTERYGEIASRFSVQNDIMASYRILEGTDWDSFVKKLNKNSDFGRLKLKAVDCKPILDSLRKFEAGEARLIAIYDFVRSHIHWNGQYSFYTDYHPEKVLDKKTGSSAEINTLLMNLLELNGIHTKPVILSTRSYGTVYKEAAFRLKFNQMIVAATLGGKKYLLDATDPQRPYQMLSIEDLNGEGLEVGDGSYAWIPLLNEQSSVKSIHEKVSLVNQNLVDTFTSDNSGLFNRMIDPQDWEADLSSYIQLSGFEMRPSNDLQMVTGEFRNTRVLQKTIQDAQTIRFCPYALSSFLDTLISSDPRVHAVDLGFEKILNQETILEIPSGYEISSLPDNQSLNILDNLLSYNRTTEVRGQKIIITSQFSINQSLIPVYYFQSFKTFLEVLKAKETEPLVLTKK